jgi:hypothetical protein
MTATNERRPEFLTVDGWAIGILLSAGAVCEREYHGYMKDHADPQARSFAIWQGQTGRAF